MRYTEGSGIPVASEMPRAVLLPCSATASSTARARAICPPCSGAAPPTSFEVIIALLPAPIVPEPRRGPVLALRESRYRACAGHGRLVPPPLRKDPTMILINVKFPVKPEYADRWPEIASEFTETTLAEPGNLWFEWSRSVKEPNTYVLIEAFTDEGAGPHVDSPHFKKMQEEFPQYLEATPQIVSHQIDSDGWGPMGEITVD